MPAVAESYYRATSPDRVHAPPLNGPTQAAVCVIGGGFAGLNTALGLVERGADNIIVLEADDVGFGASGRNGGFVFGGFSRDEQSLLRELGPQRAQDLYRGTIDSVALIRERIDRYRIDCDAVDAGVIWANWFRDPAMLRERQQRLAQRFGVDWQWLPQAQLRERIRSSRYHDGLFEPGAFHFHPLKYACGIADAAVARGVTLHEHTPAIALERRNGGWRVRTPEGTVDAKSVVLACGGYLAHLDRRVDASVMPIATYVMVTEPLGARMGEVLTTQAAVYDTRFAFDYYRPLPDTRLLWGGQISVRDRGPDAVRRLLYRDLLKVFPQLDGIGIDFAWSGLMSYARHQMPQIGQLEEGLWLAQAFGGHGVAPTTLAGEVIAAAIAEGDPRWRQFADYGVVSAFKPAGFVAAQLSYSWHQFKDGYRDWRERHRA